MVDSRTLQNIGLLRVNHSLYMEKLQWLTDKCLRGNLWLVATGIWSGLLTPSLPRVTLMNTYFLFHRALKCYSWHSWSSPNLTTHHFDREWKGEEPLFVLCLNLRVLSGTGPKVNSDHWHLHGLMCGKGRCWISIKGHRQDIQARWWEAAHFVNNKNRET